MAARQVEDRGGEDEERTFRRPARSSVRLSILRLERALTTEYSTRASPILWRLYLEFEIRAGTLQRAKKLFFRAVGECPLVKGMRTIACRPNNCIHVTLDLYLVAFGPLRSVFTPRELNELADTMAERGIRMRQGLDEALVGWADPASRRLAMDSDDDDAVDEIEYNARELRRLRPY